MHDTERFEMVMSTCKEIIAPFLDILWMGRNVIVIGVGYICWGNELIAYTSNFMQLCSPFSKGLHRFMGGISF